MYSKMDMKNSKENNEPSRRTWMETAAIKRRMRFLGIVGPQQVITKDILKGVLRNQNDGRPDEGKDE